MPDVSLVLALHREGHYLSRTLASLAEAALYARGVGISTELVAVLDRSDPATEAALNLADRDAFQQIRVMRSDNGSLGLTRNHGCDAALGNYIATADGDDLISFNYIERMLLLAEQLGPMAILVPQFYFGFGNTYHIAEFFDLDQVTPLALLAEHPFVSRVFFHRSLCNHLTYQDVSLTTGYAYEDWHFNCNAVALGYKFHAAHETIVFYRQHESSLLARANRVSTRQIPPSLLFQPGHYRRICKPWAEQLATSGDFRSKVPREGKEILQSPVCLELMAAANAIEPAIHPERLRASHYLNYLNANLAPAIAYLRLCEIVGEQQFDEVFLLPFLTAGGADRYVLDVMTQLCTRREDLRILVLFGEPFDRYSWLERLPPRCVNIDLCATCPELNADERDLLCLKLIQSCARDARLHLRSSAFAQRFFARFAPVLAAHRPIFYRFSDGRNIDDDLVLIEPSGFFFVSEYIETLDKIVCDNAKIIAIDRRRLRFMPEKWHLLYTKMDMPDRLKEPTRVGLRSILWISRLDPEKRPELLVEIARLLAVCIPDAIIDVYGRPTLDEFDVTRLSALTNVRYHGYFQRLEDIFIRDHRCFLYTSRFDGMPTVLLEMIAAGLPVIAPDVGGIGEVIRDRDTGLLLDCTGDDSVDAQTYVSAIEALFADPDLHERLRRRAWALVAERHAPCCYAERVDEIFGSALATWRECDDMISIRSDGI